jgi:hypothetical protein
MTDTNLPPLLQLLQVLFGNQLPTQEELAGVRSPSSSLAKALQQIPPSSGFVPIGGQTPTPSSGQIGYSQ